MSVRFSTRMLHAVFGDVGMRGLLTRADVFAFAQVAHREEVLWQQRLPRTGFKIGGGALTFPLRAELTFTERQIQEFHHIYLRIVTWEVQSINPISAIYEEVLSSPLNDFNFAKFPVAGDVIHLDHYSISLGS